MSRYTVRAEQLAELLWSATRMAGGWLARCPRHPETGRDLFVAENRVGNAVIFCRRRCTLLQVVNAALDQEYRATVRRRRRA